ncbi:MAG: FecR domain-containing protein [Myxococcales bacterium]
MGPNDKAGPPRRLSEGGDGSAEHQALASLLAPAVHQREPTSESRERVWAGVRASRATGRGWLWLTVPAALCGLLLGLFLRPSPVAEPVVPEFAQSWATLTLASGEVSASGGGEDSWGPAGVGEELASGTSLRTGMGARAHVRVFEDSGLLLGEGTEVRFVSAATGNEIRLERGSLVATVAKPAPGRRLSVVARNASIEVLGTLFAVESGDGVAVRVGEGQVRIASASGADQEVSAGQCWTSASRKIERCPPPADESTLRGLTRRGGQEGRIVVDGDPGLQVEADGVVLGRPPIQWWTPARSHTVTARSEKGEVIERAVTVEPRGEVRVALHRPAAGAAAPAPEAAPTPEPEPALKSPPGVRSPSASVVASPRHGPDGLDGRDGRDGMDGPAEAAPIPAPVPSVAASPELAPVPPPPGPDALYAQALRLSRDGRFAEAAAAFDSLSRRDDRFGALSLYELGQLRHRSLKDPSGAMAAFGAYRLRFPSGDLRHEVDLSAVEASLALGDVKRSLAEANLFLSAYPASERARLVLRIRADLERDSGDCAAALADYQRLLDANPRGAEAEEAWFGAALCDARLGHAAAARERLLRYLDRFPAGKFAAQAKETLEKSSR